MPSPRSIAVDTRQQASSGRCAGRTHMEITEDNAFFLKLVQMGRSDQRIAVAAQVTIALIVGHNQ